jgi:DNA mismatch endonuclease, patch repair protein
VTDIWTAKKRSEVMSKIRGHTGPELALRRELRSRRIHFTVKNRLPGTPDLIITERRVAIFVNGCFWHGCPRHYRAPSTRQLYWAKKLSANQQRDRRVRVRLRRNGWSALTVWECQVRRAPEDVGGRIERFLKSP